MFNKILIVGAGTMGSQIGFQCALHGRQVVMYDVVPASLEAARKHHKAFADLFQATETLSAQDARALLSRITYESDLALAAVDVDLVSESVPESLEIKEATYRELARLVPAKAVFTTNTSTLLPSQMAPFTGRPNRFLALHFAVPVWATRLGEVMPHPGTDPELVDQIVEFARDIGMVPIRLDKEQPGYVINSVLVPFITSGLALVVDGVASFEDVDRTWMITTQSPMGPIGWIDLVGVPTVHHVLTSMVEQAGRTDFVRLAAYLKTMLIDKGKLGVASDEGFYHYPDPSFARPDFLT